MSYHYEIHPDGSTTPGPASYDEEIRRVAGDLVRATGGNFQEVYEMLLGIVRVPTLEKMEPRRIEYRDHGGPIRAGRNPVDTRSGAPAYRFIVDEAGNFYGHRPSPIDPDILRRALRPREETPTIAAVRWPRGFGVRGQVEPRYSDGLVWVDLGVPTLTAGGIEWRRPS